jgi:ATP-dependent Zn protease
MSNSPSSASTSLAVSWRRLTRATTAVALISLPSLVVYFMRSGGDSLTVALAKAFAAAIVCRGLFDVVARRFLPWPSLFGTNDPSLHREDIVARRRAWYWRKKARLGVWLVTVVTCIWAVDWIQHPQQHAGWMETFVSLVGSVVQLLLTPSVWLQMLMVSFLFLANFLIFMGPLVLMGVLQIKSYEPGDADWGVKLGDVRGQDEAKEEIRKVVTLWQSGEVFEKAGGKRERGLLFLGPPGTGKTMMAKAIATGFNAPFVSIPGSGFAQTFIGIDVVIVNYLAMKAKRLARKWGGTCIVFIDEIDAVGMRRQSLGATRQPMFRRFEDFCFYGPEGALTPSGDLIQETRAWRDRLFAERHAAEQTASARVGGIVHRMFPGMFGGGQMALNQLLVVMDGLDSPPFFKRLFVNRINTLLDAFYLFPQKLRRLPLRLPKPRPRPEQIYFIGATNVPLSVLDPALTRPGRMGRHVDFRTPTKDDRRDIFDLYLGKVAHAPELDTPEARDELARITSGYSPAMIDQVCSLALTYAQFNGHEAFEREHLLEAMTTIESGSAINVKYLPEEARATAIHEAGHAVCAHVFMKGSESTRLSIKMRGDSLGHHMTRERDERFTHWRSEQEARLVWGLGAMAAEHVFYGENSSGVGGDVHSVTARAGWMVGACAMAPAPLELPEQFADEEEEQTTLEKVEKRFEQIGLQIMRRTGTGDPMDGDPTNGTYADKDKRALAAQFLGRAYLTAYAFVLANKAGVERLAELLLEKKEIYGDELLRVLDHLELRLPEIDVLEEATWPKV